jgi:hypothetical protein
MCMARWRHFYHTSTWHGLAADPRTAPSDRATLCTYHAWFATDLPADGAHWSCAPCITAPNVPYAHLIDLIKLRTSNHTLAIQRLREVRPNIPRALRICTLCGFGAVQDERHMLFDCPHLAPARIQYGTLLSGHMGMKPTFTDSSIASHLAAFVHHHCVVTTP